MKCAKDVFLTPSVLDYMVDKLHMFVENGVAIHMYYNWNTNYIALERQFCKAFFS